jgi:flagellin
MLSIFNNVTAMGAQASLGMNSRALSQNMAHLSSGLRINDASDDAAGLAISEQMSSDIRSYQQAARNANDGVSMMQVASGAMNQQVNLLTRMKELATEAANGTLGTAQNADVQTEFDALADEIDRVANATKFNGQSMLNASSTVTFQVGTGANTTNDTIAVTIAATDGGTLGTTALKGTGLSAANVQATLGTLDTAIQTLSTAQATVGTANNRLTAAADNATQFSVNLQAAESRIRDVDVASESTAMSRNQVLVQAGTAVLAQANQLPQAALTLLRG